MNTYLANYNGSSADNENPPARAGVLLVNLGTPDAPTAKALRPYLAEFLSDPRVIELPAWRWRPILHGFILRWRPARSAHAYARIWTEQGSPLRVGSQALTDALQHRLDQRCRGPVQVALAMRYGQPSLRLALAELNALGVRRLLVLPLYPQYSATSTGSVLDALGDGLKTLRWPPELRTINEYHDDPAHIQALAQQVRSWWAEHGRGEHLLCSFHGIPKRYVAAGDPYEQQCRSTTERLRQALDLSEDDISLSYQSRVGREPWLSPYTDETVKRMAGQGLKRLDVFCPGFAVDCLETLEEIAMQNRDFFLAAGGEALRYIPALNDSPAQVEQLTALIQHHAQGWAEFATAGDG